MPCWDSYPAGPAPMMRLVRWKGQRVLPSPGSEGLHVDIGLWNMLASHRGRAESEPDFCFQGYLGEGSRVGSKAGRARAQLGIWGYYLPRRDSQARMYNTVRIY